MYYVINYNNGRLILLSHGTLDDCLLKFCRNVAINPKVTIRYLSKYHIFEHKGVYIVAHSFSSSFT
jgi:hypothetical protein